MRSQAVELRSRPRYEISVRSARNEPWTRRQRPCAPLLAVLLASCAAPEPLTLELPADALTPDASTLVLSLEYGDSTTVVVVDRRDAAVPTLPSIEAWDQDEPAAYSLAVYAQSVDELDLAPGPAGPVPSGAPTTRLPSPTRVYRAELAAPTTTWTAAAELPPSLRAREFALESRTVDCSTEFSRGLSLGADDTEVLELAATSRTSALVMARIGGVEVLAELLDQGQLVPHPLPDPIAGLVTMVSDGAYVYGLDTQGRLVVLELHGELRAFSEPGVASTLVKSVTGEVYTARGTTISAITAGSTRARALPDLPNGPSRFSRLAIGPAGEVLASEREQLWVQRDGAWRRDFVVDPGAGSVVGLVADELGLYAVSGGRVWRRRHDLGVWEDYNDRATVDRNGVVGYGHGRLVVFGSGGQITIQPNETDYEQWCFLTSGTLREIERASIDPSGRTLFAVDRIDGDGSERGALVVRIELPR